jgi:hypothetical protein
VTKDDRFFRVLPCDPKVPGLRLRADELTELVEETVLPERVDRQANRVLETHDHIWLTEAHVRWLHGALGELVKTMDEADALTKDCGHDDAVVRNCPYAADINNKEQRCKCCRECAHECAMDI